MDMAYSQISSINRLRPAPGCGMVGVGDGEPRPVRGKEPDMRTHEQIVEIIETLNEIAEEDRAALSAAADMAIRPHTLEVLLPCNHFDRADIAVRILNNINHDAGGKHGGRLSPEALAEIVRQHLGAALGGGLDHTQKLFWLAFAEQLGPDWIASFSHTAGFVRKVGEF